MLLAWSSSAMSEARRAFVVGINTYDNFSDSRQLVNAVADAKAVAKALEQANFDYVTLKTNVSRYNFNLAWQAFLDTIDEGDTVAFYFSGHGVEVEGKNYLLPRSMPNINYNAPELIKTESLSLNNLLQGLVKHEPAVKLVILDACRNNPLIPKEYQRNALSEGGLTDIRRPPEGTFIMYAAGEGETALDRLPGDDRPNSVFTRQLLKLIPRQDLTIASMARKLRAKVVQETKARGESFRQVPAYYDRIIGEFCLPGCQTESIVEQNRVAKDKEYLRDLEENLKALETELVKIKAREAEQRKQATAAKRNAQEKGKQEVVVTKRKTKAIDSSAPIVIPTHNWSSQIVMAYVIGGIFESLGNNVEYVPADSQAVYESIRLGDVTISHEVWNVFERSFDTAKAKGGIIDAGTHAAMTREEVGVPQWVIDRNLCPGLPNWEALKHCKDVFRTTDSGGKGRILDGPQSWHGSEYSDRVQALLGDDWVVQYAGGADRLWQELASAKKEGRGTIIFNWTPNFTDREGFVFIEWPPYYPDCRKQDGGNSKCGSPLHLLKKAANENFPKSHPKAYMTFSKISFNTTEIGQMAALVDVDKMSHRDAAQKWLADHESVWRPFTED